jgi:hypothetical protein
MKKELAFILLTIAFILGIQAETIYGQTYCNPLNLNYGFSLDQSSGREIADPTVVLYKDNYFLFASNAGGYWHSGDLLSWKFVSDSNLPLENPAPTAVVIGDWIYFFTSLSDKIFRTKDPAGGKWEVYGSSILMSMISDFAVFADTDGRVYCYYGCNNNDGVMACELDAGNLIKSIGIPAVCDRINPLKSGRKKSTTNSGKIVSYNLKGSWMIKYQGKYYYQCTELNNDKTSYSDFVYVSDSPKGPFTYAANNPVSFKPDGFVNGAHNGTTFEDKYGNWWHIAILTAPSNPKFPPRLGLFPAGFDSDGNLFAKTDFGDYPMIMPNKKYTSTDILDPQWSLLSDNLTAQASSSLAAKPVTFAFDENIGTYWSAQTGEKGEWLSADFGSVCTINAFQLNFSEHKTQIIRTDKLPAHQFLVEYSIDQKNWKTLSDKTSNTEYQTNLYEVLRIPVQAQYVRITNYGVPVGNFAISGFRFFGSGTGREPKKISSFRAIRDYRDPQLIKLSWEKLPNATGYNIRYGTDKEKLYHSYQVYKKNRLSIHCPDKNRIYWFEIDTFNENGITPGKPMLSQ